jgi:flagellar biosynthesis protein
VRRRGETGGTQQATALRYPQGAEAPFITAKAKGEAAKRLLEIAEECGVPIIKDVSLSNVLTLYEAGSLVPPETYEILASIFAFLTRMEQHEGP